MAARDRDEHPLRVPLNDLRSRPRNPRPVSLEVVVEGLAVGDARVDQRRPVAVAVDLESAAEGVTVAGTIEARWIGSCNLCLNDVEGDLLARVNELYADEPLDEETYKLDHEYIDLEPLVSDAILLELPMLVRCPFGGIGLCERVPEQLANADMSDEHTAAEPVTDPRWAVLEGLTFDEG
ncbi:MAG: hypothetical protein GY925_30335 [Actinomycetia bacterium]|nr:hypothetical protein [Actinomycetes bacterium]